MKKKIITVAQMSLELQFFFAANQAKVNTFTPLQDATVDLISRNDYIRTLQNQVQQGIKGFAFSKKLLRSVLANQCEPMRKKIQACASANGNSQLFKDAQIPKSAIMYGRSLVSLANAQNIYDMANGLSAPDKTTYNITPSLPLLSAAISAFESACTARRNAVVSRQTVNEILLAAVKDNMLFIRNTLDPLMGNFYADHEFFIGYNNARILIDSPSHHAQIKGTVTDSVTNLPLQRVKVTASNGTKIFEDITDLKGIYKIPVSPELYDVKFELPSFTTENIQAVVDSGETQKISVSLHPSL